MIDRDELQILRKADGLKYREIAELSGEKLTTVWQRLNFKSKAVREPRQCFHCQSEFVSKNARSSYCSQTCYREWQRLNACK